MVANDRRVTAFVLSMLKTNANVRRSDLERGENAVRSRWSCAKRRNISINVVQRRRENGYICKGNFVGSSTRPRFHCVLTTTTSFSSLYFVFIFMSEDIKNLLILHKCLLCSMTTQWSSGYFRKKWICLIYSRRENVVETPWGRRALAIHV